MVISDEGLHKIAHTHIVPGSLGVVMEKHIHRRGTYLSVRESYMVARSALGIYPCTNLTYMVTRSVLGIYS